jgi:uncharacterized protein (DUF849 family)
MASEYDQPQAFGYPSFPVTEWPPLLVNVALNGVVTTREQSAHVPLTDEEVARDAAACFTAGARIFHLHARGRDGRATHGRDVYRSLVEAVREHVPEAIICVTTSGRAAPDIKSRAAALDTGKCRPELASLTLGSVNFPSGASVNDIATIEELARAMQAHGVRPELEVFDLGMVTMIHRLLDKGLIEPPLYVNLMLGFPNSASADARSAVDLISRLPVGTVWSLAGLGAFQRPMAALAAAMGGGIRTGLEDNPYRDHRTRVAASNPAAVAEAAAFGAALGRECATPDQVRGALGLARPMVSG